MEMKRSVARAALGRSFAFLVPLLIVLSEAYTSSASADEALMASAEPMTFRKVSSSDIAMRIDGRLLEKIWSRIDGFDSMKVISPDTMEKPENSTLVRIFYTEDGLYVGIVCEQESHTLVSHLTSRDTTANRDAVSFVIDPSGRGLYSYWFKVGLGGTLVDGTVLPEKQMNLQWDGPWRGASSETDEGWSAEMFLPWSMVSMPKAGNTRTMRFYVSRNVAHKAEMWAFPALPETKGIFVSGFHPCRFENINPKMQYAIYPYTSATYDEIKGETDYRVGLDAEWRPSTNFQLTATVDPDFGQVESDDIVVNLTAFETYFPEKRLFFLEGYEIFVTSPRVINNGGDTVTLVNTRRIGGAPKPPELPPGGQIPDLARSQPTDLHGAVKLTGQQGKLRYGLLAAFEEDTRFDGTLSDGTPFTVTQDGRNFGVMRVLYENTETGGRRSIGWTGTGVFHPEEDALVQGLDVHYMSPDKELTLDAQLLGSEVDNTNGTGGFFDMKYIPDQGTIHSLSFEVFDDKLDIGALGYLRRNDSIAFRYTYEWFESDVPGLQSRNTRISYTHGYNTDGDFIRSGFHALRNWTFLDNSGLSLDISIAPARWEDRNSYGNGSFRIENRGATNANWSSDSARKFSYGVGLSLMTEDLQGITKFYSANMAFRPSDRFSFRLNLNYSDMDGWLLHQSGKAFATYEGSSWSTTLATDLFLTAKQQFRISGQWAAYRAFEQDTYRISDDSGKLIPFTKPAGSAKSDFTISQLTFQARYRWQIAPLSDLFLVYTRGSNLPSDPKEDFGSLLTGAWSDPIVDTVVLKLRYRFGN